MMFKVKLFYTVGVDDDSSSFLLVEYLTL